MDFRLLYSGRLLGSSRTNTRAELKHDIRREFHPQLRRLWTTHHGLTDMAYRIFQNDRTPLGFEYRARHESIIQELRKDPEKFTKFGFDAGVDIIGTRWERCGYKFVPLVTKDEYLRASLDILLLRPDEPRFVVESGDLDARVKTIFDSLRLPDSLAETGGKGPQTDETPFYCLFSDDKLISEIRVSTDELLVLPKERDVNPNDVFLVIHVTLKPTSRPSLWGNVFD